MEERFEQLEAKVDKNYNDILNNINRLHNHEEQIKRNTGAIEVLHTIKTYNNRFFMMWLITFMMLIILTVYVCLS